MVCERTGKGQGLSSPQLEQPVKAKTGVCPLCVPLTGHSAEWQSAGCVFLVELVSSTL